MSSKLRKTSGYLSTLSSPDRAVPGSPLGAAETANDMEQHVRAEQTRLLYGKIWTALLFTLINGIILGYVQGAVIDHSLVLYWLGALTLVTLLRGLLGFAFNRTNPGDESLEGWRRAFLLGVVLAGLVWGSTGLLLFPPDAITHQVFLAFVVGGMAAGAVTTLSYAWPAIGLFLLLSLSPLIIRLFMEPAPMGIAMGSMFLLYLAGILSSARQTYSNTIQGITLRLQAVSREASIRRFKSTLDNTLDCVFMFAPDSCDFFYVNQGAMALVGYSRQELMSMSLFDIHPKWSREGFGQLSGRLCRDPAVSLTLESRYRHKDGSLIPVEMFLQHVHPNGDSGRFVAIVHDITERRRAEDELRRHSEQQATLSALSQYALAGADLDALMDRVVVQVADNLGMEYAKVLELSPDGQSLSLRAGIGWKPGLVGRATVSADSESQAGYTLLSQQPVVVEDLQTEERFSAPVLLSEHQVVSGISVTIGLSGRCFGVLGCHTAQRREFNGDDVNFIQVTANLLAEAIERKQVEKALLASEARFRHLFEYSPVGYQSLDSEGRLREVNTTWLTMLGYERQEVLGRLFSEFLAESSRHLFFEQYETAKAGGEVKSVDCEVLRRDGSIQFSQFDARFEYARNGEFQYSHCVMYDITERRRAEEQMRLLASVIERTPEG